MDRNDVDWAGYLPAVTTPFDRDGAIRWDDFAVQTEWLVRETMHGMVLAGTTGEWFSLTERERAELFTEGARNAAGRFTVIGGCNAYTAEEVVRHVRAAERAGLDGVLVSPPPYVVPSRREIVQFFRDVSDATEIPICVYNWPRGCAVDLDVETLAEIAEIDHVVAIKNSTGNFAAFLDGLYGLGHRVRYFGMPTNALGIDLVNAGRGDGLMGAGAVLGADHPNFWRALAEGDTARALALGGRDRELMADWVSPDFGAKFGSLQSVMKTALRMRGVPAGYVRKPLLELLPDEAAIVAGTLTRLGIPIVEHAAQ